MFEFRPELVDDDDAEADDTQYDNDKEDEEEEVNISVHCLEKLVRVQGLVPFSIRLKLLFNLGKLFFF